MMRRLTKKKILWVVLLVVFAWPVLLMLLPFMIIFSRAKHGHAGRSRKKPSSDYLSMSEEMFGVFPHHDGYQE